MRYLSVHDLVWLNAIVVGEETPYDYELLENAMAAQYGYGDSRRVDDQAARVAEALAVARPFRAGNLRSALLATATFLAANGCDVAPPRPEVRVALQSLAAGDAAGSALVEALGGNGSGGHAATDIRGLITEMREQFAGVLADTAALDPVVEPWTVSGHLHRS